MDLSQRMDFCHWILHFSKNISRVYESLKNGWFNMPITQIYIFILFVKAVEIQEI